MMQDLAVLDHAASALHQPPAARGHDRLLGRPPPRARRLSDDAWVYRVEYQNLLRRNALGSFTTLLKEAIPHPCMGLYLDNVESTKTAINENLGRELLECHTVGLNYTQKDVINSARILTGFHVDQRRTWRRVVRPGEPLGRPRERARLLRRERRPGWPEGPRRLPDLPGQARLHRRLVCAAGWPSASSRTTPPTGLVASLAKVYQDSNTQIRPVLRALVASDEFKASALRRCGRPVEDALATWNALRVEVAQPHHDR